jgi:MFS family permease
METMRQPEGTPKKQDSRGEKSPRSTGERLTTLGWAALAVVCVAVFLSALDQTVVVTALISMVNDIGVPILEPDRAAWIVSGYLLGYVVAMPLMGRVADVFGRWRVFAICLTLFALGSLLCALAPQLGAPIAPDISTLGGALLLPVYNAVQGLLALLGHLGLDITYPGLDVLVGARFIQAVGGGALVPVAMAVVGDLFGATRRGAALGLVGAVTEAGGVLGPLWGAWITQNWGWTWIFYLNIPLVAALLVAGYFALPRQHGAREPIDVPGALLFGASLTCLTIGLGGQSGQAGAYSTGGQLHIDVRFVLAAAALFALFVFVELHRRWPVVEPALFRRGAFSAAAVLSLLIGIALIVALVDIPLFIGTLLTPNPIDAGLALLRLTALIPVGALIGGWLTGRFGCPPVAVLGTLCAAAGFWLMHLWPANVGWEQITMATVVAGLGFGLVIAPISTSALNASAARQVGVASSVVTALRMTGMILGLAALTSWGLLRFKALVAERLPAGSGGGVSPAEQQHIILGALHQVYTDIFAVTAGIALLAVIPALLLWRRGAGTQAEAAYESYVAPLG